MFSASRDVVAVILLLVLACACVPAASAKSGEIAGTATTLGGDREAGARVYTANCATCHGATGKEGGAIGPSLRNENERMDFGATVSWIEDPQPPMPVLYPKILTQKEVRDVAAYVQSL